ncbi:MAG TPA: hypothetical protein VK427_01360, partial [Kofleriaceae bacterium]|nr:hypothetical protein [Kofleriaceae bacterium]
TITMNMLDDGIYFDSVVKAIAAAGAPALRKLRIGEFQHAGPGRIDNGYDYEISWSSLGDARHLWRAVPRLEELRIQAGLGGTSTSGDADVIGTFDLRALRRLEVVTGGMGGACARSFATGKLPALQYAELWFGSKDYGGTATVADLEPLFTGRNVRELAHLGLMNAEITDELVAALARSPLLRQLRTLNLAHGTLSDEGVRIVATHADAFKHLKVLDVSNNYVTSAGLDELRRVCPITSTEQRDTEDDDRYVALAE